MINDQGIMISGTRLAPQKGHRSKQYAFPITAEKSVLCIERGKSAHCTLQNYHLKGPQ